MVAVSAAVLAEPLVASLPDQPPDAAQLVALVVDQVSVDFPPLVTEVGLALRVTLGDGAFTLTTVDCAALPPAPVHVRVYVVLAVRAGVVRVPCVALVPVQPPEAVHEVALVEDQVSVALEPLVTVEGLALKVTVGEAAFTETVTDCDAVPPAPVQVRVYRVVAVNAGVDTEPPPTDFAPLQPPDAVQEVALVEDQVSVEAAPFATVVGFALKLTVGAGCVTVTLADCAPVPPGPMQVKV